MVKFWPRELDIAIKRTKRRIAICEKMGIGQSVIAEKEILKKQQRQRELINQ